eukprot:4228587-Ditylum_brightwellii.AAC.1
MNYLGQAGTGSDSWQKGFAMEGKSDVTIGIQIRIAYIRNYTSVVRLTLRRILGCRCPFGGPAASRVVHVTFPIVSCSAGYNTWILNQTCSE